MIQQESWQEFYPDCLPLFEEHDAEIGEQSSDMPLDPNVEGYAGLDKAGMLQILTARQDGKLIGYCIFVISQSLQSRKVIVGTQNLWFVTKEKRRGGIAGRLYLKSIALMRAKGVKNIYPHYYVRGDAKLKRFFERLGAKELQHEYSLGL